jgi:hypothetical protein
MDDLSKVCEFHTRRLLNLMDRTDESRVLLALSRLAPTSKQISEIIIKNNKSEIIFPAGSASTSRSIIRDVDGNVCKSIISQGQTNWNSGLRDERWCNQYSFEQHNRKRRKTPAATKNNAYRAQFRGAPTDRPQDLNQARRGDVAFFASRTEASFDFRDESTASDQSSTSTIPISFPATDFQKLSSLLLAPNKQWEMSHREVQANTDKFKIELSVECGENICHLDDFTIFSEIEDYL